MDDVDREAREAHERLIEESDWRLAASAAASARAAERELRVCVEGYALHAAQYSASRAQDAWARAFAWLAQALFGADFRARSNGRAVARYGGAKEDV